MEPSKEENQRAMTIIKNKKVNSDTYLKYYTFTINFLSVKMLL